MKNSYFDSNLEGYDIIGDVHGYASKLKDLLIKLGYKKQDRYYKHANRKVIFVGDYIDRGAEEESVCSIVKNMVENDAAFALMGNHEFNAICYASQNKNGEYLRLHNEKNYKQHEAFLNEFPFGSKKHQDIISWFKTLPLFFESESLRVVHAAWDNKSISYLKNILNEDFTLSEGVLQNSAVEGKPEFIHIEKILKGIELNLGNKVWKDKDGNERNTMRFNWFEPREKVTYKNSALSFPNLEILDETEIKNPPEIYSDDIPVLFGHYWMTGKPKIFSSKIACVDYSVAKDGCLVAYRWSGEKDLNERNFVF